MAQIESARRRGIAFLQTEQTDSGSFTGHTSATVRPFKPERLYQTTFLPALILGALSTVNGTKKICLPLAAWLRAQVSTAGSFNYWAKEAPERQTMPYPDDLDDTFCSLIALQHYDPALIDSGVLGAAVKLLLATEQQVGGPYRTWLVPSEAPASWQDVDLAVNCNIAYFLQLVAEPLPNLTAFMDKAIITNTYTSPYYPSAMPVLYYMARAYTGEHAARLAAHIASLKPATALDHALRISALLRLGYDKSLEQSVQALLRKQQADGSWPADAFCLDAARQGKVFYHGAPTLTTAFALEALGAYQAQQSRAAKTVPTKTSKTYADVIALAKEALGNLDTDLRSQATAMVDHMAEGDVSQEIALLPQLFNESLAKPSGVPDDVLAKLSLANLFGWMAYTIYDNFLDGEGQPVLLSVANVAMRMSLESFISAAPDPAFITFVRRTFDTIDGANTWETVHCRFTVSPDQRIIIPELPRFGDLSRLAERSYGHMLTPLAILMLAGYPADSKKAAHVKNALHHYLIARQLQDDLHDWEDDFRGGRATAVVAEVLRSARILPGEYDIAELLPRMQRQFWQLVLPLVCTRTERHLALSRKAMQSSRLLQADGPFYALMDRLETMVQGTRAEQTKAAEFLAAYKKPLG
ncbi:MAG TPA: hypothetical protein VLH86_00240 [Patescibacteria group bacterium]|nr:hypothetical protein [Patescibacteria group bacterium]